MDLFEKYNLSFAKIAKIIGLVLLAAIVIMIAFTLLNSILRGASYSMTSFESADSMPRAYNGIGMQQKGMAPELSTRNIIGNDNYTPGMDAEEFEVTEYSATIESRKLDNTCNTILSLKGKDYVVFENSNKGETNCNFRFKVKKQNVDEVLALVRSLDPRDLTENVETIKKRIEDFTSQEDVLKKKLKTIEETLDNAVLSYDELSKLATQTRDAGSLASIIKGKIEIIDNLSQQKINISSQLDNISRQKAEQLDRLEYTYFNVNVYENKYVDVDYLKDSWKSSIKSFVYDMNKVAQDVSIGLVKLVVYVFQYLLYLFIIVLTGKYVWVLFKKVWNK